MFTGNVVPGARSVTSDRASNPVIVNGVYHWSPPEDDEPQLSPAEQWRKITIRDAPLESGEDPNDDRLQRQHDKFPRVLISAYRKGEFNGRPEVLAAAVMNAWSCADRPTETVSSACWRSLFQEVREYLIIPSTPVDVYRGCKRDAYSRRMSWSGDRERARWFANREDTPGLVYRCTVGPEYVLAHLSNDPAVFRPEDEYVLDPDWIVTADIHQFEV